MGQISMEIIRLPGSVLSGNQHLLGFGSRHSVILLFCCKRPDHSRHLIRQCNGRDHLRLAYHKRCQPTVRAATLADNPTDHAHGAHDQQATDVGLAHLADRAQPGLAASRPLPGDQAKPGGKVAPAVKCVEIRCECRDGASGDGADPGDGAQSPQLGIELMRWMPPPQRHHVCHDGFIGTEGRAHR